MHNMLGEPGQKDQVVCHRLTVPANVIGNHAGFVKFTSTMRKADVIAASGTCCHACLDALGMRCGVLLNVVGGLPVSAFRRVIAASHLQSAAGVCSLHRG